MEKIEFLVLKNLLHNEEYLRKVIPFLKSEYYQDNNQKIVFEEIQSFVDQYNDVPTKEVLTIEIEKRKDINESTFKELAHLVNQLDNEPVEFEWLCDTTEKWCKERAVYLALLESINIADGGDDKRTPDAIPSILSDALAVGFDRYYGLLELGELGGLWKNVAGRYEIDGKKVYAKAILKDPETYFTPEVMEKLDQIAKREFSYGEN